MLGVYTKEPPTVDPSTGDPVMPATKRSGWLRFGNYTLRDLALVMLAGRWGYLWWLMFGGRVRCHEGRNRELSWWFRNIGRIRPSIERLRSLRPMRNS